MSEMSLSSIRSSVRVRCVVVRGPRPRWPGTWGSRRDVGQAPGSAAGTGAPRVGQAELVRLGERILTRER